MRRRKRKVVKEAYPRSEGGSGGRGCERCRGEGLHLRPSGGGCVVRVGAGRGPKIFNGCVCPPYGLLIVSIMANASGTFQVHFMYISGTFRYISGTSRNISGTFRYLFVQLCAKLYLNVPVFFSPGV